MSSDERVEPLREAMTMVLYLSLVLLATLTALPTDSEGGAGGQEASGVHGIGLVALIWGTSLGLALAHWFSFRLTARAVGGGYVSETDVKIGVAQMGGAVLVAVLCTIPVFVVGEGNDVKVTLWVPALIVGIAGYFVSRASGRTRTQSLILGGVVMVMGFAVAAVKNILLGH